MPKEKLTANQTLLLGQAITALDLAQIAAKEAEKKLQALESSLIGTETKFSEAVCEAVGDIDEAVSSIDSACVVSDFAYEDSSERRVSKMLRGMDHRA